MAIIRIKFSYLSALALALAVLTIPSNATPLTVGKRCIGTLPELTSQGVLSPGAEEVDFRWSTTCVGTFSASVSGGAVLSIQRAQGGIWYTIGSGVSTVIPNLVAGSYRIVVRNTQYHRINYSVRHRRGLG
jgi:hypothetical protein